MSDTAFGAAGVALFLILLGLGVPLAFAMGITGIVGITLIGNFSQAITQLSFVAWERSTNFVLTSVPLFVIMGMFVFYAGLADKLYDTAFKWLGRLPGGLAVATVMANAAFGSVCGSSVAAVGALGAVTMPSMEKYGYSKMLATGCLAASGTLAILIPPSLGMVVYAVITDESLGQLFVAGIFPGILSAVLYASVVIIWVMRNPASGPPGPHFPWVERFRSLAGVGPTALLFVLVIGGIYAGIVTPTEAAGYGAFGALAIALVMKKMSRKGFMDAVMDTGKITAMVMALIIGAIVFSRFMTVTGLIPMLLEFVTGAEVNRYLILVVFILVFLILGCFLDAMGFLVLTMPVIFPTIRALGFDGIWFGIITIKTIEVGLVTPPFGMNVFVMAGIAKDVSMENIFKGIVPFVLADFVCITILVLFPAISLWLPAKMIS